MTGRFCGDDILLLVFFWGGGALGDQITVQLAIMYRINVRNEELG